MESVNWADGQAVEVAQSSQVHTGKATILSNISGDQVEEYEIEIVKIFPDSQQDGRDYLSPSPISVCWRQPGVSFRE